MKPSKNKQIAENTSEFITVKTGSVDDFFSDVQSIMRSADSGESIKQRCATLRFVNPSEMLRFLSAAKLKLIDCIRSHPDSVTNIAKTIGRNRAAVYRDIHEMETYGLVKMHEAVNPGHGRHKIVELMASSLKLEAYI
jgi:predicted transcriptional regulator